MSHCYFTASRDSFYFDLQIQMYVSVISIRITMLNRCDSSGWQLTLKCVLSITFLQQNHLRSQATGTNSYGQVWVGMYPSDPQPGSGRHYAERSHTH